MSYGTVEIDTELLRAVERRTDTFEQRDEWIEDAISEYVKRDDLPDRPELGTDEYRAEAVENAIRAKLD